MDLATNSVFAQHPEWLFVLGSGDIGGSPGRFTFSLANDQLRILLCSGAPYQLSVRADDPGISRDEEGGEGPAQSCGYPQAAFPCPSPRASVLLPGWLCSRYRRPAHQRSPGGQLGDKWGGLTISAYSYMTHIADIYVHNARIASRPLIARFGRGNRRASASRHTDHPVRRDTRRPPWRPGCRPYRRQCARCSRRWLITQCGGERPMFPAGGPGRLAGLQAHMLSDH
jgi:hypothetical protein